ncbi:hypothetical protein PCASD_03216 [Puccinia coronata f. sp. avenae]|uniref:Uncharacterized protein n=1 Tax=Puccinia coronata f. sp. avenae TaxID=200324 RepID=A0A2N5VFK4_9BASI|nr:hypothetical protein PCASD_03216 [Puccinia coronata f. sp. avenae]
MAGTSDSPVRPGVGNNQRIDLEHIALVTAGGCFPWIPMANAPAEDRRERNQVSPASGLGGTSAFASQPLGKSNNSLDLPVALENITGSEF